MKYLTSIFLLLVGLYLSKHLHSEPIYPSGNSQAGQDTIIPDYPKKIYNRKDTLENASGRAFKVNSKNNWGAYNSFCALVKDSVQLELILYRNVKAASDWANETYIGAIDSLYWPKEDQFVVYKESDRRWLIRIENDGECLVKLLDGSFPKIKNAVLPIQVRFKRN